ncbi:GNAT family N-acetyltransferase [Flexivirga aerilata]|uniref:GNAT family N-acetyltransferase n=1 Tax=Flexivirga aerilata TaxID=1656889 RepID=UPI001BB2B57F
MSALPYPEPALTDGRIGIRRWSEGDVDCVREASSDPRIVDGTTVPTAFTHDDGLAFIRRQWSRAESGTGVAQAIVDATTDVAVGLVAVTLRPQPGVAGLGYWVVPSARGRGAAAAAVRLVTPWALNSLGLQRLEAWVVPQNIASQRVLRGAGYLEEGRLRSFLTSGGKVSDALVFSVISSREAQ